MGDDEMFGLPFVQYFFKRLPSRIQLPVPPKQKPPFFRRTASFSHETVRFHEPSFPARRFGEALYQVAKDGRLGVLVKKDHFVH